LPCPFNNSKFCTYKISIHQLKLYLRMCSALWFFRRYIKSERQTDCSISSQSEHNLVHCSGFGTVYEETAGLTVRDPVLRTHKVELCESWSFFLCVFWYSFWRDLLWGTFLFAWWQILHRNLWLSFSVADSKSRWKYLDCKCEEFSWYMVFSPLLWCNKQKVCQCVCSHFLWSLDLESLRISLMEFRYVF
jgi:hypothetical protein